MEYFVSAEDTAYYHWQLELLIESFKINNSLENLVIGLAKNNEAKLVNYNYNIRKCSRMFQHENMGRKRGSPSLNRPYALYTAVANNLIKQPFALIDPSMLMFKPIMPIVDNVAFQIKPMFSIEFCNENLGNVGRHVENLFKEEKVKYWIPLGSLMVFNGVNLKFFTRVLEWVEKLEYERKSLSKPNWQWTERVAWILTLLENSKELTYKGIHNYEMMLLDSNKLHNFVNYEHGLPPVFSKHMYTYKPPDGLALGNLWDVLLANNPTTTTDYMQKVVKSYLNSLPKPQKSPKDISSYRIETISVKN